MAEFTENLNLEMPDKTEQYNVAVQNSNMKKIDDFSKLIPPRALTADKLTTGVNINNVFFDGTQDIEIETGGSGFNLGDMIITDHILEGDEAIGKALQGTYVSGAVYPDFYNRCLDEKNSATATETTLADGTLTMYVNSNGHQFYNISDKTIVDAFYNTYGIADFYGIDEENERIFLPRNKHFFQLTDDTTKVNQMMEAGLPNIEGVVGYYSNNSGGVSGAFYREGTGGAGFNTVGSGGQTRFDASRSNSVYGNSDTVQPLSSLKLLYYVVGNVVANKADIDVSKVLDEAVLKSSLEEVQTVIETYENGSSGYRTWSNGYHEEWGQSAVTTATTEILLLKSYKNTNYSISMTGSAGYPFITSRTIGSFVADASANATVDWKTSGYLY